MTITAETIAHPSFADMQDLTRLRFYSLSDESGPYAAAAVAEHPDALELHLTVQRFGPATVRALRADMEELKRMARGMGKTRIIGLRVEPGLEADPRWPKFTRLFGFTGQRVLQAAELSLD
ncbi:MAG: hypothetical protein KKF77_06465 [Proteobacteria bacterium]|nr:hypothetical protein [Pseudomonadota bacterium]